MFLNTKGMFSLKRLKNRQQGHVPGNLGIQAFCRFPDCLGNLQIAQAFRDCCVQLDCLSSRRTGKYFRYFVIYIVHCHFLFGILSSRGIEHKKHRKANSNFSHYEKDTRSSSAYI